MAKELTRREKYLKHCELIKQEPEIKQRQRRDFQRRRAMKKRMGLTAASTIADKIAGVRAEFISRLIDDSIRYNTQDYNLTDEKDVKRLRNLLAVIRDEIQIVRALVDVYTVERAAETQDQTIDISNMENVELLDKAREQLKKAGIQGGL